jgi:hypothetical protein
MLDEQDPAVDDAGRSRCGEPDKRSAGETRAARSTVGPLGDSMNSMRRLIGFVLALALAVLALPASADFKAFQIVNPTTPVGLGTQTIDVSFKNTGDNSSFNSLTIKGAGTGAGVRIDGASSLSGKRGSFAKLAPNEIQLSDLSPTKVGDSLTIRLTVFVTATGACAGGSIAWTGSAWTGSPTDPSNRFALTGVAPVTDVTAPCSITIANQPADALKGQVITNVAYDTTRGTPVTVSATYNGQPLANNVNISLTSSCTGGSLTLANASVPSSAGVATFNALASASVGTGCTLTANVPTLPALGSSAPSSVFKIVAPTLTFTGVPSSVVPGVGSDFTVTLLDGGNVIQAGGSASLTVVDQPEINTCTLGPTSQKTDNGVVTFRGIIFGGSAGACELLASATFAGVKYTARSGTFGVYAKGDLDCVKTGDLAYPAYPVWTGLLPPYAFDGSPWTNDEGTISFFKGVRGGNILTYPPESGKNIDCIPLNYTLVNNVPGTGPDTTSQAGKTVPVNAFALFYDEAAQPNATFRTLHTYRDEWTDESGWLNKRTKVCLNDDCTVRVKLKACLGITLVPASMPVFDSTLPSTYATLIGTKMPACVVSEIWSTVIPDASSACTTTAPPGPNAACVRVTSELILVGDPVVPREQ